MDLEETAEHLHTSIHAPAEANSQEIKGNMFKALSELYQNDESCEAYKLLNKERLIVSTQKLKELKGSFCTVAIESGVICNLPQQLTHEIIGSVCKLRWTCHANHHGMWVSSEIVTHSHHAPVYLNNLLVTASILLSGNQYAKVSTLCKFLQLCIPSSSVFCRDQRLFHIPVIMNMWETMKNTVEEILSPYDGLILGGDGRNDSPGFSARFGTYFTMDLITKVIVDMEVLHKRHTGGILTNMEREARTTILLRLMKKFDIGEFVTDASSSIIKRIRDLKGMYLEHSRLL